MSNDLLSQMCVYVSALSSAFSAVLSCCTASCVMSPPAPPPPPRLMEAGVTWLSLEWSAPCGTASRDTLSYVLEMEELGSVSVQHALNFYWTRWRAHERFSVQQCLLRCTAFDSLALLHIVTPRSENG